MTDIYDNASAIELLEREAIQARERQAALARAHVASLANVSVEQKMSRELVILNWEPSAMGELF